MNYVKFFFVVAAMGLLASCTSRNTRFDDVVDSDVSTNWHVHKVEVTVPDTLSTTEVNLFQPDVDIVWHGDFPGLFDLF